jgi:hypothetical protein
MPLAAQIQNRAVLGGTMALYPFPQILRLGDLAGTRLWGCQLVPTVIIAEGFFALHGLLMLPDAIDQAVARGDEQKPAQVVRVDEAPASFAETAEHIGPD